MIRLPQHVAAEWARKLDATRAARPDEITLARLDAAADLLQGIGYPSFVRGLADALADIDERILGDAAASDCGRGYGNDPDAGPSPWLERHIDDARDEFCREFIAAMIEAMAEPERVMEAA